MSPAADHRPPRPGVGDRPGRTLLVLRRRPRALHQGRGAVHGADVCRLSGRPRPWTRLVSGDDPGPDAGESGVAAQLGATAPGLAGAPGRGRRGPPRRTPDSRPPQLTCAQRTRGGAPIALTSPTLGRAALDSR